MKPGNDRRWMAIILLILSAIFFMLDEFVVAVLILNMKFDSNIIVSKLENGTTLFAISVVLLMTGSFIARKFIVQQHGLHK